MKNINASVTLKLLILLSLVPYIMDMFIYEGVFVKYFRLQPNLIFLLFITLGLIWITVKKNDVIKLKNTSIILFTLSLTLYVMLGIAEYLKYPNFVFSTFHIHYGVLASITAVFLAWFVLLILSERKELKKHILFHGIILILITYYCFTNVESSLPFIDRNFSFALSNPGANYDQKMEKYWGGVYSFIAFVKRETPENSSIVLPDINAGGFTGNQGMVRYFLYPRKLVSSSNDNIPDANFLIATPGNELGEGNYKFWPVVNIKAVWVKYYDANNKIITLERKDYDPQILRNNGYYALLKLK